MSDNAEQRDGISDGIKTLTVRIARSVGIRGLEFTLTEGDKTRLLYASILPSILLAANLIGLALDIYYGDELVFVGGGSGFFPGGPVPEFWQRVYNIAEILSGVGVIALAGLFIAGIPRVSRGVGSWAAGIAMLSLAVAGCFMAGAAFVLGVLELPSDTIQDLRVHLWVSWSHDAGLIAVGYAFLAYRGLSDSTYRPREVVRQRRSLARRDEVVSPDEQTNGERLPPDATDD